MSFMLTLGIIFGTAGFVLAIKSTALTMVIIKDNKKMAKTVLKKKLVQSLIIFPVTIVLFTLGLVFFRMDYYDYGTISQFIVVAKNILIKRTLRVFVLYFIAFFFITRWIKKLEISGNV